MNEGQRRLQEAFEKAKEQDTLDTALPFLRDSLSVSNKDNAEDKQLVHLKNKYFSRFFLFSG